MNETPEPTELVVTPPASWVPAILAAGLASLIVGLFTWWPYAVIGAIVVVLAKLAWLRRARRELVQLPRRQRLSTAPIPLQRSR